MPRYVIEYKGGCIELPQGETLVGRGLHCRIRFNDPAVSRRHLRLHLEQDALIAEDVSPTNPIRVNGEAMTGAKVALYHEDVIDLGKTWFRILMVGDEDQGGDEQTSPGTVGRTTPETRTGTEGRGKAPRTAPSEPQAENLAAAVAAGAENFFPHTVSTLPLPSSDVRNCPDCRTKVPTASDVCSSCGARLPPGRPESPTVRLNAGTMRAHVQKRRSEESGEDRREHPRVPVDLPAIYDSDLLAFDAVARNVSLGGLFLATELLDDIGTECKVTVLPDGAAAIPIKGVVCRTVGVGMQAIGTAGMGIRFTALSTPAKLWLSSVLLEGQPAAPAGAE